MALLSVIGIGRIRPHHFSLDHLLASSEFDWRVIMEGESNKQVTTKPKGIFSDNYINIGDSTPYLSAGYPNKHGSSYPPHGYPQLPPTAYPAYGYPQPVPQPGYASPPSPPPAYTYSCPPTYGYAHGNGHGHGLGQGHGLGHGHGHGLGNGQQHQHGYYYQEFNTYNAYGHSKPAAGGFGYHRHGCMTREVPADATN